MKPVLNHPSGAQLAAFLAGKLDDAEQAAIESHIAGCGACCKLLQAVPEDPLLERLRGVRVAEAGAVPVERARDRPLPRELLEHPRYKVSRFLGAGGMGVVYQAEHRVMERPVALKLIHPDLVRHPGAVERFRQEVKAAARLAHPNIVTAYDAEQAGTSHFLVMEFVDGITLARLVHKRGRLGVAHACNYVRQAAQGLQHAFESGMVHRDIKPHNLMLTRKGQIKILDFGLACLVGDYSVAAESASVSSPEGKESATGSPRKSAPEAAGHIVGTPDYMAPEQTLSFGKADIRADIYSLGCTLYFLLTGQPPFGEGSALSKVLSHRYYEPRPITELRDDVPPELATILGRMMAKESSRRYQTPAEVVKALALYSRPGQAYSQEGGSPLESSVLPAGSGAASTAAPVVGSAQKPTDLFKPPSPGGPKGFSTLCPYCPARLRVPVRALGASVLCPQCGNYFTAVPEQEESSGPVDESGQDTAGRAATFSEEGARSAAADDPAPPPSPAAPGPWHGPPQTEAVPTPWFFIVTGIALVVGAFIYFSLPVALATLVLVLLLLWVWKRF